jgi:NAD(P)-dependent dehydrogenase (short-subunit alcohol dehydrogenase family)
MGAVDAVMITGCSSGIGLLTAVAFARRGDDVVATMRDPSRSERLVATADGAGVALEVRRMDVTDDVSRGTRWPG